MTDTIIATLNKAGVRNISTDLWGIFYEDISYSGDGGLNAGPRTERRIRIQSRRLLRLEQLQLLAQNRARRLLRSLRRAHRQSGSRRKPALCVR